MVAFFVLAWYWLLSCTVSLIELYGFLGELLQLAGCIAGGMTSRMMLRLLSNVEDVRQTLKMHSSMLQAISRQLNVDRGLAVIQLPDGLTFPMQTYEDVDTVEIKLSDAASRSTLVSPYA